MDHELARLRMAHELAGIGSWSMDLASGRLEWSPAMFEILGLDTDTVPDVALYQGMVHEDDRAQVEATHAEATARGEAAEATHRIVRPDGDVRWVHARSQVELDGDQPVRAHGILRDITEERRQQARFEAFLDSAPDAMILVGSDGRIHQANAQTERMFGYARDELVGEPVEVLVPEDARSGHPAHREQYSGHPKVRPMGMGRELHAQRKDGSLLPVEISLSPVHVDGDRLVIAAVRDITERKEMEAAAQAAREQRQQIERLEEVTRFKTQLLNTASHELNTPITPLRMQLHLLDTETLGDLNEKQKRSVAMLKRNVDRLSLLVSDVLDVARMESGKLRITPEPMEIDPVLQEVFEMFDAQAQERGIDLQLGPATGVQVEADRDRLLQVVINFVSNALKFTPEAGVVRISATADEALRVAVTDTGRGLSEAERKRLFQAFSQVHSPQESTEAGTGLGLYIAKGIIEQHGGRIGVDSDGAGRGSTFWFELPTS